MPNNNRKTRKSKKVVKENVKVEVKVAPKPQRPKPKRSGVKAKAGKTMDPRLTMFRLAHEELWKTADAGAQGSMHNLSFVPGYTTLPILDKYGAMFEEYTVHHISLHAVPIVGTTKDGMYVASFTYDLDDKPTSQTECAVPDPKLVNPIWKGGIVNAVASRCNKQRRMMTEKDQSDSLACHANVWVAKESLMLFIKYDITFFALRTKAQSISEGQVLTWDGTGWKDTDGKPVSTLPDVPGNKEVTVEWTAPGLDASKKVKAWLDSHFGPNWVQQIQTTTVNYLATTIEQYARQQLSNIDASHLVLRVVPYPFRLSLAEQQRGGQGDTGAASTTSARDFQGEESQVENRGGCGEDISSPFSSLNLEEGS